MRLSAFTLALMGACLSGAAHADPADSPSMALPPPAEWLAAAPASPERTTDPALTLDEVVRRVVDHNPALQSARRSVNTAVAGVTTARALPNPRLDVQGGPQRPRVVGPLAGRTSGWSVALPIENPALRQNRIEAAQATQQLSREQVRLVRSDVVAQVKLQAYEHVLHLAEAQAAAEALGLLTQIRARVKLRVDSGEAARYELIKADAEIINARQRVDAARLRSEQSLLSLNRLAAGQLPAQWRLSAALDDPGDALGQPDYLQRLQAGNPELQALQAEVARNRAVLDAVRASRWPGVEVNYGQSRDPEIRNQQVGLSIQIPLLDRREGPIAEATSELERAQGLLEGRQAELQQRVRVAWKSLQMAQSRAEALSQGAVREAEAALRVAEAAYRFGERGILDVLDAQRVLRSLRADLLEARFQIQAARIELDLLTGRHADD